MMKTVPVVNEQSTSRLDVEFFDELGQPVVPSTVSYRIDELDTQAPVKASTGLTPASVIALVLSVADNTPVTSRAAERRRVTVSATYGAGEALHEDFDYVIRNLSGV